MISHFVWSCDYVTRAAKKSLKTIGLRQQTAPAVGRLGSRAKCTDSRTRDTNAGGPHAKEKNKYLQQVLEGCTASHCTGTGGGRRREAPQNVHAAEAARAKLARLPSLESYTIFFCIFFKRGCEIGGARRRRRSPPHAKKSTLLVARWRRRRLRPGLAEEVRNPATFTRMWVSAWCVEWRWWVQMEPLNGRL